MLGISHLKALTFIAVTEANSKKRLYEDDLRSALDEKCGCLNSKKIAVGMAQHQSDCNSNTVTATKLFVQQLVQGGALLQ